MNELRCGIHDNDTIAKPTGEALDQPASITERRTSSSKIGVSHNDILGQQDLDPSGISHGAFDCRLGREQGSDMREYHKGQCCLVLAKRLA